VALNGNGAVSGGRGCGGMGVGKGSSLRELNDAIFDAMVEKRKGGAVRVGMGRRVYGVVGGWVPRGLVGWMMGVRRVGGRVSEFGHGDGRAVSPGASVNGGGSSNGSSSGREGNVTGFEQGFGMGESEYVSVYGDLKEAEDKAWKDVP